MLLEQVFPKCGDYDKQDLSKNLSGVKALWESDLRCQAEPYAELTDTLPAYRQPCFVLAGLKTVEGKIQNPEDLMAVIQLRSELTSFKNIRTKYFNSDWGNNNIMF